MMCQPIAAMKRNAIFVWLGGLIAAGLISQGLGESVSLTVKGGVSLVGEHCPGIVRLFCNATELSSLRWKYNGNTEIVTFFPDSIPSIRNETGNLAFLSVVLTSVSPIPNVANYSTYLTVDLGQLQAEDIMSISCGNTDVLETEQVDVTIARQLTPYSPTIIAIVCSAYASSLSYEVRLSGPNPVQMETNYSRCGDENCTANFNNLTGTLGKYEVSIVAFNKVGVSSTAVYPTSIEKCCLQNLLSAVSTNFSTDCLIVGRCALKDGFNTTCTLRYTTDSRYIDFLDSITGLSNEQFNISGLSPSTTYYFEFSYLANNTLFIMDQIQKTTQVSCDVQLPVEDSSTVIIIAVLAVVFVVLVVVVLMLIILCTLRQQKKKKKKQREDKPSVKITSYSKSSGSPLNKLKDTVY